MTRTIDTHTHILADATIKLLQTEIPKLGLKLTPYDDENSVVEVAGVPYRPFPRGGHNIERRFADMDAAEVDMHVLSVSPQTWLYNQEAAVGVAAAAIQNDEIARLVQGTSGPLFRHRHAADAGARKGRRRIAPRHGQARAARRDDRLERQRQESRRSELRADMGRRRRTRRLHGDSSRQCRRRRPAESYYLGNLIGNPLDTTIAAACLIFGGVMERYPNLNFMMVHGGGFIPYQGGRWVHGWEVRPEPKVHLKHSPQRYLDRFFYDTITHNKAACEFLVASAGVERVFLGSDYPYDMGTLECARQVKALGNCRRRSRPHSRRPRRRNHR